jgi:tRNA(fMet)-specific endonuclease VapC
MRFMLDTDTCIYVMKYRPPQVRERLRRVAVGQVGISSIVLAELMHGIAKSAHPQQNAAALGDFLDYCKVLDWPAEAARFYGDIRTHLERKGKPIGSNDLLIAAHALAVDAILVSNNLREFCRVPKLRAESWAATGPGTD